MSNMKIYDSFRNTPQEAKKTITGGRLNGFTDISPMYRIEALTRQFGPCGIGWYYEVARQWEQEAGEEVMCFVNIALYIKVDGEWSKPIHGTGGSMLLAKERNGLRASDEGYKMATTDAFSVACKQLGIGADVYWAAGETKYNRNEPENAQAETKNKQQEPQKAADEWPKPNHRPERVKALCAHHGVKVATFGDILKALQEDGKLPAIPIKDMTDTDFNTALSLVHAALQETRQTA